MPYNTRRKSLSLSELGIIVPKRARSSTHSIPQTSNTDPDGPPIKRTKSSHDGSMSSPPPPLPVASSTSPSRPTKLHVKQENQMVTRELSPPLSPRIAGHGKVDLEGINDDIVIATIQQLEDTGNRPLFIRELGAILADRLACVEKSANPTALISSRLTQYLSRPWPMMSPCPLAKDLSPAHPRRLYFYLRTMPRQPVPDVQQVTLKQPKRIISPSVSSASAIDEEEHHLLHHNHHHHHHHQQQQRPRTALSPSPEVDLSSPELDGPADQAALPGRPFSERNSAARASPPSSQTTDNRRAASPQLEVEERDFKQTANSVYEQSQQRRKDSQDQDITMSEAGAPAIDVVGPSDVTMSIESDVGVSDATTLFGHLKSPSQQHLAFSSPLIRPQPDARAQSADVSIPVKPLVSGHKPSIQLTTPAKKLEDDPLDLDGCVEDEDAMTDDSMFTWDNLQNPESIALDELDDLFKAYY